MKPLSATLFALFALLAAAPSCLAANGSLTGFGDAHFGMTRAQVQAQLSDRSVVNGNNLRAPAPFKINGKSPWTTYRFDKHNRLHRIEMEDDQPATYLDCLSAFQLYLHFLSAQYGKADYLFQDSHEKDHYWRAMFLFEDGGAVHLNVNFGPPEGCTTNVTYLPSPIGAKMVGK